MSYLPITCLDSVYSNHGKTSNFDVFFKVHLHLPLFVLYKRFRFIAKEIGFSMHDFTFFQHADVYCIYELSMHMSTRNNLVNIDLFKVHEHGKLFQIFMK